MKKVIIFDEGNGKDRAEEFLKCLGNGYGSEDAAYAAETEGEE